MSNIFYSIVKIDDIGTSSIVLFQRYSLDWENLNADHSVRYNAHSIYLMTYTARNELNLEEGTCQTDIV